MARMYPISLAVKQAQHVAQEKNLGPLCMNAVSGVDLTRMVEIHVLSNYVESLVSDTYYYKEPRHAHYSR